MKKKPHEPEAQKPDLKVWWGSHLPGKAFEMPVASLVEAKLLLTALAKFERFQNIRPSSGGVKVFDGKEWFEWASEEGKAIDQYTIEELRGQQPKWEGNE